ncbi:ead/Ea22-like family protein [Salmonella enterica]|uniref:Ead/Ea22-like family protein n=5 Tax=Salmonella enterica TaxID=28901 RepID=A0A734CF41_SALET|nr:ead/Ea22-like family protein [Salmonella enterica]EAA3838379.1 ead/Ea22-like family protein [Salmonella enterica subsp. houtenae]EAA7130686.1 ead/Ea22-like family protein [Salmonella enterica subsp. enterica serovar Montevideo]EAC0637546.1 ead/Ea22-like family protein [Salmonella enterica subsp. enterica serovar Monschaui]EAS0640399.1 ead/Ea22-like family protein [Salmonella enterica subsp. enterica serovar Cotham]EBG2972113.1 ead/Ea22-like family protein [Salmonella enterica subsp. enteric
MTIDKQALREVAEKATPGTWRRTSSLFNGITVTPFSLCGEEVTLAHTVEKRDAEFIAAANPATVLALLDELEHYKSREERVTKLVLDNSTSWDALYKKLEAAENNLIDSECHVAELEESLRDKQALLESAECRIAEQSAIVAAAEKLVRCKGRYHSELNYRALAKLFGVITPDLPPLEHENVHYADAAEVEITALRQHIAELERSETQLINERDSAESALNDAYKAVMGQAPEWSNWFSFENAIDEIELACELWRNQTDDVIQFRQRIQELEARQIALPQRLSPEGYHIDEAYMVDDAEGEYLDRDAVIEAISAAGIKVKES